MTDATLSRESDHGHSFQEVVQLLDTAFPETPIDYFRRILNLDPDIGLGKTFLWRENGTAAAIVQVFHRIARWGESGEIKLAVIGNVGTHPDFLRRGLAAALLRRADQDGLESIEAYLPSGHPAFDLLTMVPGAEQRHRSVAMLHDLRRSIEKLKPPVWAAAPFFWPADWC
ncbi:MAG: GNAT family N-acetyltransferase [Actinobacteria bacterium]|nr:GNAT family N-acetyltransferase [Actinomycetota bacterium]